MSLQDVLHQLQGRPALGRFHYLIAQELHQNEGVHFHVVLINYTKLHIRSEKVLDLECQGITYHGNYQAVKYYARTMEYVCKKKQYVTDVRSVTNL